MQLAEGGGAYNPAGWLYEPTPGDPVPTTFDGVIGVADWLSLGHWALVVLDKVDGDFDLVEKVQTWVAGDWEHVAVSAEAIRHLKLFTTDMADAVDAYSGLLDDVWDGNAAQAADLTFISITTSMRKAADMLDIAAKGYDDVAQGLYGVAKDVGNLVQTLIDLLIAAGISAAATAAGSWTPDRRGHRHGRHVLRHHEDRQHDPEDHRGARERGHLRRHLHRRRARRPGLGRRLAQHRHPRRLPQQPRPLSAPDDRAHRPQPTPPKPRRSTGMTDPSSTPPLLPALPPNRALDEHLRRSLAVLRDRSEDAGLRDRIDDVIRGRSSLRALSRDPAFGALMEPLVTRGMQQLGEPHPRRAAGRRGGRGGVRARRACRGTAEPQGPDPRHLVTQAASGAAAGRAPSPRARAAG